MLRLSKKLICSIEAVVDIAYNSGDRPVQSVDINTRQGIPKRYLEPVLQQLVKTRILAGVRGPHGGYRLAKDGKDITIADIAKAVQATEGALHKVDHDHVSELGNKVVKPLWSEMIDKWMSDLATITIEDLCEKAEENGLAKEYDYPQKRVANAS